MAKLDEIAELLTEEIKSFGNWVVELKVMLKNINDFGFEPDTSEMERLLNDHQSNLKTISEKQYQALDKVLKNIEKSRLIPKWGDGICLNGNDTECAGIRLLRLSFHPI